jgi:hypothetical protein
MKLQANLLILPGALLMGVLLLTPVKGMAQAPAVPPTPDQVEDGREADRNLGEFLGQHPELREQLNKNPNLINNPKFVAEHPELQEYMEHHPKIAAHWKEHPTAVMGRVRHFAERHDTIARHPAQRKY